MGSPVDPATAVNVMLENNLEPLVEYPGAGKPWKVKCKVCNLVGTPTYAHVKNRGGGCRDCGRVRTANAKRIHPEVAAEMVRSKGYEPIEPFLEGKAPWRLIHLACGSMVTPNYTNIAGGQGGCISCGKIESAKKRRLDSNLCMEEIIGLGFRPLEEFRGVKSRWKCSCASCEKDFTTSLENARKGAHPLCPSCNRSRMGKKRRVPNEIARRDVEIAGLTPIGDYPGLHKPWNVRCNLCQKNTEIRLISIRIRIAKNSSNPAQGCETCVFASLGKSRMFDQLHVEKRLSELGMRATGIYFGALEPISALCLTCGTENQVLTGHAFSRGNACSKCSIKRRSDSARKPQEQAISEMLHAGFKPLEPYSNVNSGWRAIHLECGKEVSPSLGHVKRGQGGCSHCAHYGFDSTSPAVFYILSNKKLNAIKVGITGKTTTRLDRFNKLHGWVTEKTYDFPIGHQARTIEKIVLSWWRIDLGAPIALGPADSGALGGWTETASLEKVSVESTLMFVSGLEEKKF